MPESPGKIGRSVGAQTAEELLATAPRTRKGDDFQPSKQGIPRVRPRYCRATTDIGGAIFRCTEVHKPGEDTPLTHVEEGAVMRKGKKPVRYSVTWWESEPMNVRHQ